MGALVGACALAAYAATAARTITWWDGSHYPLLARTLGITNPPGSLLLTLLGWAGTVVRVVRPVAFQFNLIACALGALTTALVARLAARLATAPGEAPDAAALAGGAGAAAVFATSLHAWTYATQFTPYILTVAFTALLVVALLRWWDRAADSDDVPGLFVLALLFGLDVSVHRTNLLWLPAAGLAIVLRRPRALLRPRVWAALGGGAALGLSLQLGYLVLGARRPWLDMADMTSLDDLMSYERLDPMGGGFLINLWPRRADWLHVQLTDWLRFVWLNLGGAGPARVVALLFALAGLGTLARRSRRLALALLGCFLAAGLGAVLYFNRPAEYFRPLDRHYLPSWVLLAPWIGIGLAALARLASRVAPSRVAAWVSAAFALALAGLAVHANAPHCDRSHTRVAETFARDLLEPLPPHAILVTNGDNDTFPLWYLQRVEGVRSDVLVLNEGCTTLPCMVRWLHGVDPAFAKLQATPNAVEDVIRDNAWRRPVYFAVTLPAALHQQWRGQARIAGLVFHVHAPGDTASDAPTLERFVRERLPRAGISDRRQLIDPDVATLLTNYAAAGAQRIRQQVEAGDYSGALATLTQVERDVPLDRFGSEGAATRELLHGCRTTIQAGLERGR